MKKFLYWGIVSLIVLIGISGFFLLIDKDSTTQPEYVLGQKTKDMLKNIPKQQETVDEVVVAENTKTFLSEQSHVDETQRSESLKLSVVDKLLEQTLTLPTDSPELKIAKIEAYKKYYREQTGQDLPPIGHYHVKGPDGVVRLIKEGEPFVPIKNKGRIQFCPSPEQLKKFDHLKRIRIKAWQENDREEYNRIESEIYALKNSPEAQGVLPTTGGFAFVGMSPQEASSFADQKLKEAYEKRGYGHLWGRYDLGPEPLTPLPFPNSNR